MIKIGTIDVGSNAIRAAVHELTADQKVRVIDTIRSPIRLGSDVFSKGFITEDTLLRMDLAFDEFKQFFLKHNVNYTKAVGTSALRETKNQSEVIERIFKFTDIKIEIISGEEEARLVYRAVNSKIDLSKGKFLLVEIGGGSIETTIVKNGNIIFSDCVAMGTVRLLELLDNKKFSAKVLGRLMREYARGLENTFNRDFDIGSFDCCIATGGNVEELVSLKKHIAGDPKEDCLKVNELSALIELIQPLSLEERISQLNLRKDRADVILPAALVLEVILKHLKIDKLISPKVGVRDGLALEIVDKVNNVIAPTRRAPLLAFTYEFAKRYNYNEQHAKTVALLSLVLFEQLQPIHKLKEEYKILLELAAILHDIGQFINYRGHHKHTYYLIIEASFIGLTTREHQIVATLARYHRKSAPKKDHSCFQALAPEDKDAIKKLAGILRIADALDKNHNSDVETVLTRISDDKIFLCIQGKGDFLLEKWAVTKKSKLFNEVFEKTLVIED
ncbi:MAG: Ppx/GppA family phosphatase [Proteobacteria bacterium]|nr:Ppx/GppA family phosphatase [Pseudomonadota bacterium]